jgi:hypothetical protein
MNLEKGEVLDLYTNDLYCKHDGWPILPIIVRLVFEYNKVMVEMV